MFRKLALGTLAAALVIGATHARPAAQQKDIVDTAVAAGSFKTLAAALTAAGLVDTLKGAGPFTVFAPTDEAFAKLPAGTVESLLKPENKAKLVRLLTYHVVAGKVMAADVVKVTSAKAVSGDSITVKVANGVVTVDNAKVRQHRHRGLQRRDSRHRRRDHAQGILKCCSWLCWRGSCL